MLTRARQIPLIFQCCAHLRLSGISLLAGLTLIADEAVSQHAAALDQTNLFTAKEPVFVRTQDRSCRIAYASPATVLSPMSGVLELQVQDNDDVHAGDSLAVFDAKDLERQKARLSWRKDLLQSQIDSYETDIRPLQMSLHRSRLAQLDSDLTDSRQSLERLSDLAASNRVSEGDVRAAEKRTDALLRARSDAENQFAIRMIEDDLRIEQWRFEIFSIDLDLEEIGEKLSRSEITASLGGIVTGVDTSLGANGKGLVREGAEVLQIADPLALSAVVKVTEEDMLSMRGASASIRSSADPSLKASARIARTTPVTNDVFSSTEYEIEIAFRADRRGVWEINSKATCRFERPTALTGGAMVPLRALKYDQDTPFLDVVNLQGTLDKRAVSLGMQSQGMIHVVDGIEVGERVHF